MLSWWGSENNLHALRCLWGREGFQVRLILPKRLFRYIQRNRFPWVLEENRWLGQEKKRKSSRGWRLYEQRLDSPEKLNRESWDYHLYYQVFAFDFADLFGNIRLTMNQILIQGESLLFFSLPFLAMSDRVFSFQINGFNVRYAQIVLIFLVLSRFLNVVQTDRQRIFSLIKNQYKIKKIEMLFISY